MIFCYGCGKEIHETATTCPSCGAVQKRPATTNGMKYTSYIQVPWYRKNWFAILCFFIFMPGLFLTLLTGPVYYEKKGQLLTYSVFGKIFLLLYSLAATAIMVSSFANYKVPTDAAIPSASTISPTKESIEEKDTTAEPVANTEQIASATDDKSTASDVPDNIKQMSIAINNVDQKILFGRYIDAAEKKHGVKTTVEFDGRNYLIHHIIKDKLTGNAQDFGLQFTPSSGGVIFLDRMTIDGTEVVGYDRVANFILVLLAIAPDHPVKSSAAAGPSADMQKLLDAEASWNDKCRGGSGDDPSTQKACDRRDAIFSQLKAKGWCWGREGQTEADKTWQRCPTKNAP